MRGQATGGERWRRGWPTGTTPRPGNDRAFGHVSARFVPSLLRAAQVAGVVAGVAFAGIAPGDAPAFVVVRFVPP